MSDEIERLRRDVARGAGPTAVRRLLSLLEAGAPEWEHVSEIPVDSGRVVIADPGYVGVLERTHTRSVDGGVHKIDEGIGGSMAVVLYPGFGDGSYPVLVRRTRRTKAIAEVRVVFVPEGKDLCTAEGCQFGRIHVRAPSGLLLEDRKCPACDEGGLA